ncbi:hypothetical protein, partial [Sinorhizobium meliloti]|uniref:hypothetical protein n=1 Tax=Rhizobium meliloti TaxID=382 RepID=UPI001F19C7BD
LLHAKARKAEVLKQRTAPPPSTDESRGMLVALTFEASLHRCSEDKEERRRTAGAGAEVLRAALPD